MKYLFIYSIYILSTMNLIFAQSVRYHNFEYSENFEEILIQTAIKNYPEYSAAKRRVNIAKENLSITGKSWLNSINLTYQYNPSFLNNEESLSLPKFGLGLTLNVGSIINVFGNISKSEEEVEIANDNLQYQKNYLIAEVKRRYANYLRSVNLLKVRSEAVNDSESNLMLIKTRFINGEIDLEDYNKALGIYHENMERMVTSESDTHYHKATLEEIVGVKIEELN